MKKIAVVEDNPDNMLLVRTILEDDYEIIEYVSGIEALTGIKDNLPDLVLLDISLPEMDGVTVLEKLRAEDNTKDIPVIALTAHAMVGDREKYLDLGFNDYISKPIVDLEQLINTIETCLNNRP